MLLAAPIFRYYGESKPFGNKSLEKEYIGYLTSAQALADYADLINYLQKDEIKPRYPVIAFGGTYVKKTTIIYIMPNQGTGSFFTFYKRDC